MRDSYEDILCISGQGGGCICLLNRILLKYAPHFLVFWVFNEFL